MAQSGDPWRGGGGSSPDGSDKSWPFFSIVDMVNIPYFIRFLVSCLFLCGAW